MRIMLFCPSYGRLGGIETIARSLAAEFRRAGHRVGVIAREGPGVPQSEEDVPVWRAAFHQLPRRRRHAARQIRFAAAFAPAAMALRRALDAFRPDAVLTLAVSTYAPYAASLARAVPVVVSLQGGEARGEFTSRPHALRRALRRAARVVACARSLAVQASALVPELAPHLEVIPNGVHPERYASGPVFAHPRPYIVAVGRLVPQKGFDVLIDAFAQLGVGLEVDLIIVGDGPDRESLIRGRAARGVDDRVHLLGARGAHEVAALLRGALLAVCPSRWEGLPVVCLEAMASARAVVATNVDGIPDAVVDGETGILVPPQNPRALAGVLSSLLADATTRERLGAAGRCRVREYFTWPTVASRYLGVLGAVARSPRGLAQP